MRIKKRTILLLTALAVIFLQACKNKDTNSPIQGPLKIGMPISAEDPDASYRRYGQLSTYLEEELGVEVKIIKSTSYAPSIEALKAKKIHMASIGPFAYLLARKKVELQPLVTTGWNNGFPRGNISMIVTNKKSSIKTLDDLKEKAAELSISFVDPASTSGHIIPRQFLRSVGLDPEASFKEILFTTSHAASALTVINGKVDVACMSKTSLSRIAIKHKEISFDNYNIIWSSDPIPSNLYVIRKDIDKEFREKVERALLDFKEKDREGFSIVFENYRKYYGLETDSLRYIDVDNDYYDKLEKLVGESLPSDQM